MKSTLLFLLLLALAGALCAQPQTQMPARLNLTFAEAEQMALRQNPRVVADRLRVLAEGQLPAQMRAARYPTLSANVTGVGATADSRIGAGALNNPNVLSRFATGVTVSQLLFDFGRTSYLTSSATFRARAEADQSDATRAAVLLRVHTAYLGALRARALLRVAEQTVAARQLLVDQVTALADAKLKSGLDLSFVKVSLSEAKLLQLSADNDWLASDAQLAAVLGLPGNSTFDLSDVPQAPIAPMDLDALMDAAIANRPELAAQQKRLESAREYAKAESKLRYPVVSALATAGVVPVRVDDYVKSTYAAAGVNLSIPIFNGGLFHAREQEAAYRAQIAEQSLRETRLEITRTLRLAYLNVTSAAERLSVAQQLLENADQSMDLAQARYDLGLSSIVELSQAQLAKTQAEIQNAAARYDYALQRAALDFETGALR